MRTKIFKAIILTFVLLSVSLSLPNRMAAANDLAEGTWTETDGVETFIRIKPKKTGLLTVTTQDVTGTVALYDKNKRITTLAYTVDKSGKSYFGVMRGVTYHLKVTSSQEEQGRVMYSLKGRSNSQANKSKKKAKYLKHGYSANVLLIGGQGEKCWYTENLYYRDYVRVFIDGRQMKGSLKVEIYNGNKLLHKKILNFDKNKTAWVEVNKKTKGDCYFKLSKVGKGTTGTFKIKNTRASMKEKLNKDMLQLVNKAREKEGLPPCFWDESLEKAILVRAKDLGARFSHDRPDGSKCYAAYGEMVGENITTAAETNLAFNLWMNSPGHRGLIMMKWNDEYAKKITYGFACASGSYGSVMVIKEYTEY